MPFILPTSRDLLGILVCLAVFLTIVILDWKGKISKTVFDRITLALAIAAIVFAIVQFHDAGLQGSEIETQAQRLETQTTSLKQQRDALEVIQKEMSTRSAGFFPQNLEDINDIVARARITLDIMTDYAGYGHYSAQEDFAKYWRLLQNIRNSRTPVKVRMLIYTRHLAQQIHNKQFTDADFAKEAGSLNFLAFCAKFNSGRPCPQTKTEFDALLFHRQQDYIEDLLERGVEIKTTDHELPFYFWNADGNEAVFSFLNTGEKGTREVSFRTREPKIIVDAFSERFQAAWTTHDSTSLRVLSRDPNWKRGSPINW